jgi:hypothetical protein
LRYDDPDPLLDLVPGNRGRVAAESAVRNYLVVYQPAVRYRPGNSWCRSFADTALPGDLDLRRHADAAQLAKALLGIDLAGVEP